MLQYSSALPSNTQKEDLCISCATKHEPLHMTLNMTVVSSVNLYTVLYVLCVSVAKRRPTRLPDSRRARRTRHPATFAGAAAHQRCHLERRRCRRELSDPRRRRPQLPHQAVVGRRCSPGVRRQRPDALGECGELPVGVGARRHTMARVGRLVGGRL